MLIQLYDFYYQPKRNVLSSSRQPLTEEEEPTSPKAEEAKAKKNVKVPKLEIDTKFKYKDALIGEVKSPTINQHKQIKRAD